MLDALKRLPATPSPRIAQSGADAGIVFLMTVQPGLAESLAGIGAATAVGILASLTISRAAAIENVKSEKRLVAGRGWSPEKSR